MKPDRGLQQYLGSRNRPTTKNPDSRLSLLDHAGLGKLPDQSDRRAHADRSAGPETSRQNWRKLAMPSTVGLPRWTLKNDSLKSSLILMRLSLRVTGKPRKAAKMLIVDSKNGLRLYRGAKYSKPVQ
jgi:hypothetical protein